MIPKKTYYNRILPIVGSEFMLKSVCIVNADFCSLAAQALAMCGVTRMLIMDSSPVTEADAIPMTLGNRFNGKKASKALEMAFRAHNRLQKHWSINQTDSPEKCQNPADIIKGFDADIIIGGGSREICRLVHWLSEALNIPAVTFTLFREGVLRYGIFVSAPGLHNPASMIDREVVGEKMCGYDHSKRLDWLDASDMVMGIVKTLLVRGTKYQRDDFEELIFNQKRNVILRGTTEWPWQIIYSNPEQEGKWIEGTVGRYEQPSYMPPGILAGERVMVIGCGTASLFIAEAAHYFGSLFLIDCKPFSIYNPVRQLAGTDYIGVMKPLAVQEILMKRTGPSSRLWTSKQYRGIRTVSHKKTGFSVSAANLEISDDKAAIARFQRMLDWYKPTLVVVGMGRSGENDANFVATRILRERGIRHIIPAAFPSAAYYKMIVVDGEQGPCYDCLHHHLPVDLGGAPTMSREQQEMFYGGTQPATVMETYPTVHCLLRLSIELCMPPGLRSNWFAGMLEREKSCFIGGNKAERTDNSWLYGVKLPGQVVTFGSDQIIGCDTFEVCICGRRNKVSFVLET